MTVATGANLSRNGAVTIFSGTSTDIALVLDTTGGMTQLVSTSLGFVLRGSTTPSTGITAATTEILNVGIPVDDQTAFLITWGCSATSTQAVLTVMAGEERRGWQQGQGAFQVTSTSTRAYLFCQKIIGPFESARFGRVSCSTGTGGFGSGSTDIGAGQTFVQFHLYSSDGTTDQINNWGILPFRMPRVTYDT